MAKNQTAIEIGTRIGKAIARDVLADDLPREWTGLDPQDGDQLTAAGIDYPSPEWDAAEQAAQVEYERIIDEATLVCGNTVSVDRSGVGHCWTAIDASEIPANIRQEIECEMIDGGKDECERYRASNGLYYRW